jgi:hypothetical protein
MSKFNYLFIYLLPPRKQAYETLELTGLSAALGINDIPDKLEYLVKGYRNPNDYFSLFRNSELVHKDSHIWFRDKVVTTFDDHDQVRKGNQKARFCAYNRGGKVILNVLALNALTLGIPCIYYGSEQCFDGEGGNDRYIREAMFGGKFGAFRTRGVHFFDEDNPVYQELAKILDIRSQNIVLRRGRQYLREISAPNDGVNFSLPEMLGGQIRYVMPWSRIFGTKEMLLAINTDYDQPKTAWVTIDNELHQAGDSLKCIYSTDAAQIDQSVTVEARNGKAVLVTVPTAGFVIFTTLIKQQIFDSNSGRVQMTWHGWEDLGGIITAGPAVASWAPNRLDCFVKGANNHMYHKWWNGSNWSGWEDLGGVIDGAPAAVSWGLNRIDCFARGMNNHMYHKWWSLVPTVRLHLKVLSNPTRFTTDQMVEGMRQVYEANGIQVVVASTENLNLPLLNDLDVGECTMGNITAEQNQLFSNRNNVGTNDIAIYFVRSTVPSYNGCAAHPAEQPSTVVASIASQWTLGHEVGHVLGLPHVNNNDRLMTGNGTDNITNPPPDLIASEVQTMNNSPYTVDV